jgi:hypothetical protein
MKYVSYEGYMTDIEIMEAKLLNYSKRILFLPRSILCINLSEQMLHELKKIFPQVSLESNTANISVLADESMDLIIGNFANSNLDLNSLLDEAARLLDKNGLFIFSSREQKKTLAILNRIRLIKFTLIPIAANGIKFEIYFASTFAQPFYLKKLIKFSESEEGPDQLLDAAVPIEMEESEEKEHEDSEEEEEKSEEVETEEHKETEEHQESEEHEETEEHKETEEHQESEEHEEAEEHEETGEHEGPEEHEELEEHEETKEHEEPQEHEEAEEHEEPQEHEEAEEHEEPQEHEETEEHEEPEEQEEAEEHKEPEEHEETEEHEKPEAHEETEEHKEPEEHEEAEELEEHAEAEEHEEPEEPEEDAETEEHEKSEDHEEAEKPEEPEEYKEAKEHEAHAEEKHEIDYEKKYDPDIDEHESKEPSESHTAEKKIKETYTSAEIERVINHPDTHPVTVEKIITAHTDVLAAHAQKLEEHVNSTAQIFREVAAGRLTETQTAAKLQENAKKGIALLNTYKAAVDQHQKILRKFIDTQVVSLEKQDKDNYHQLLENHLKILAKHTENIESHNNDDTLHL